MTRWRLVLWLLLGALLVAAGATLAAAGAGPVDPAAGFPEPAPWWWPGPKGDVYYAVIVTSPHGCNGGIKLPPNVRPVDPVPTTLTRSSDAHRGDAAASKRSISGSISPPAGASFADAAGSLTLSTRASSAPARPDRRDVRRELETAHRALGL